MRSYARLLTHREVWFLQLLPDMPWGSAVLQAFEDTYKREFGFVLEQRSIIVDDLRVRATGKVG